MNVENLLSSIVPSDQIVFLRSSTGQFEAMAYFAITYNTILSLTMQKTNPEIDDLLKIDCLLNLRCIGGQQHGSSSLWLLCLWQAGHLLQSTRNSMQ